MATTTIKIDGMSCGGCTSSVTKVLGEIPGVIKVEVTLTPGQAVVEYDAAKVDRPALCTAIDDAGFEAS